MTDIEYTTLDHHSEVATITPLWLLLLALITVIEIGALPVTRLAIAAVFR